MNILVELSHAHNQAHLADQQHLLIIIHGSEIVRLASIGCLFYSCRRIIYVKVFCIKSNNGEHSCHQSNIYRSIERSIGASAPGSPVLPIISISWHLSVPLIYCHPTDQWKIVERVRRYITSQRYPVKDVHLVMGTKVICMRIQRTIDVLQYPFSVRRERLLTIPNTKTNTLIDFVCKNSNLRKYLRGCSEHSIAMLLYRN